MNDGLKEFEQELTAALAHRQAPAGFKQRLLAERRRRNLQRSGRNALWQRLAATLTLAAVLGGGAAWHNRQERLRGEAAREQVLTALRVTNHALDNVQAHLAAHDSGDGE